ncbi:MAG: TatD family hydrolase [Candidatus Pacebacteria bacterium]|nr:TatD family hydrolase [Candidatus Paceibacterota bacterium]
MIIDTHSHLNFKAFDKEREKIIQKCLDTNLVIINVGSNYKTSQKAVQIARKGIYASIGLHPIHINKEIFDVKKYKKLAQSKYVIAVGETGFDFLKNQDIEKQKKVFFQHLELAKELNLPLIVHCRKAHQELLKVLPKAKGVIHCFTGSLSQAKEYLKKGLFIGFNGIIFKLDLDKIIKETPLERILVETDCPYLGDKEKNDPFFVKKVIQKIAETKKLDFSLVEKQLFDNAKELFKIF